MASMKVQWKSSTVLLVSGAVCVMTTLGMRRPPLSVVCWDLRRPSGATAGWNVDRVDICMIAMSKLVLLLSLLFRLALSLFLCLPFFLLLPFSLLSSPSSRAYFGPSPAMIALDNVQCSGDEDELFDCQHLPWGSHNCNHTENVGVACTSELGHMSEC